MSPEMIALLTRLIPVFGFIMGVLLVVGLPAFAVVALRFFKFKERELLLGMEHRQKSQQQELGIEQRVRSLEEGLSEVHVQVERLEDVLTRLDHDVRDRLGIESSPATSLSSRPDLVEGPAAPEAQRGQSPDTSRTKAR
jgi:hypothetical protein